jgi:hypothetical protein
MKEKELLGTTSGSSDGGSLSWASYKRGGESAGTAAET